MDYDLTRIDYTICGITYPDTLKILPSSGQRVEQKIAIGDKNGVLQCLSIKDEEPVVQFKTLPGKPITSLQLASSNGDQAYKIFTASGNEVKGYTRKGKVFLTIETSLSETITSMCVLGSDLILCSGRMVTFYKDLTEVNSYSCEDRVLDIAAFAAPNSARIRLLVLVANKGAVVLDNGQLVTHAAIPSGPCRLTIPPSVTTTEIYAFNGSGDGSIGIIRVEGSVLKHTLLVEGRGLGSVVCFGWYFSNGNTHLAVGRHDGSVQLYLIDMENLEEKPRLKYTYFCGEPVTSVAGGCVGTEESELLVATFSGRVFALRSNRLITGPSALLKVSQDGLAARRAKLEVEITRLEKQTANEREKYQRTTRSIHTGLSTPPLLDIQHELSGATRDGWQEANITSAVPLDMLFIYCNKKLDMQTDSAAVLSVCSSQSTASDLLATVRCQAGTRRVWVRMRHPRHDWPTSKSGPGSLRVLIYALPAGAPRVARLITIRLPLLPYYSQYEDPAIENEKRCWSKIKVSGGFSVAELTSWLTDILPGELPRPATTITFARCHTLLGTVVVCQYQRGLAEFKSDNVSTIAVIRSVMYNYSVVKGIRIEIYLDIPEDCCIKSFEQLRDMYKFEYEKNKNKTLRNALSVLDLDEKTISQEDPMLCDDYLLVWKSSQTDEMEEHFDELNEGIVQWYVDWQALSLHNENTHTESALLQKALQEDDIEEITKILSNKSNNKNNET